MRGTAVEIWKIYGFYTFACVIFLLIAGMPFFEAVNHSMTTIATGGLSTKDASIGAYNDLVFVKPVIILFMIIGAISFFIHFRILDGDFKAIVRSEEFKFMIGIGVVATLLITARISLEENLSGGIGEMGDILFQVFAMITSTGFTTMDITTWDPFTQIILLILMVMGGCYGSTTGGLKMLRVLILWKTMWNRIKKSLMPEAAIVPATLMGKPLRDQDIAFVTGLSVAYFLLVISGALVFAALDYSPLESVSASVSAVSNMGPTFIPGDEWFGMGVIEKITLIILIYAGRLEIFPMLVLITVLIKKGNV
jgi:trk system potassium uptake protein TrkH